MNNKKGQLFRIWLVVKFWSYIDIQTLNVVDTKLNLDNSGSAGSKIAGYYYI